MRNFENTNTRKPVTVSGAEQIDQKKGKPHKGLEARQNTAFPGSK